ncbi:MAG: SWIM zinc finger family protein [Rhodocyclaceae bacterium]|nr:SWIM zinc finger family protein [Rhodocyclaceae bacterium]MBX3670212.1 SWIM zinc finger family protein [Rhodocyclaceae bacterium]
MSALADTLYAQLARFDDEAFVALANRGLLRRAQKDLERLAVTVVEQGAAAITLAVGAEQVRFDAGGPAKAHCTCSSGGVCQHILTAALSLQRTALQHAAAPAPAEGALPVAGAAEPAATLPDAQNGVTAAAAAASADADDAASDARSAAALATLRAGLLAISAAELVRYAGKAGYRWAWQFVHDQDAEQSVRIGGHNHLVIGFAAPRVNWRYMGGGLDALIADVKLPQLEKYRVAAVLAFQRAYGQEITPPEPGTKARSEALDLGMEHRADLPAGAALADTRTRFRAAAQQLLAEAVELGLAHLSRGMHERFATLAVWAQGAEYHRLALLMRRIADHVELLLERAGAADEHRLLDEMTLAKALLAALDSADAKGLAPVALTGRARTRYEQSGALELLGLGASAWRSASGYLGLTMLFWCPAEQSFMSCTDARPETLADFDPLARYKAYGPWTGLGAPQLATGRRVQLTGAKLNAAGRLSAAAGTSANVLAAGEQDWQADKLPLCRSWAAAARGRSQARRSLLAEPRPLQEWSFLQPARFEAARFDAAGQTLRWPLVDTEGQYLYAELAYSDYSRHAIERIEALPAGDNTRGLIVVAQLAAAREAPVAQPLSLIDSQAAGRPGGRGVDALFFDPAPETGLASNIAQHLRALVAPRPAPTQVAAAQPRALAEARRQLQARAERGVAPGQAAAWRDAAACWIRDAQDAGFTALAVLDLANTRPGSALLQLNYVLLNYQLLAGAEGDALG